MNNSAFRDPDEGLAFEERIKLISLSLQGLRERPTLDNQRNSDCGSQSVTALRAEISPPPMVPPSERRVEEESLRSELQDSLPYRTDSITPMGAVKRPNHEQLDDQPSKRRKLEMLAPLKQPNSQSIGYLQAEALQDEADVVADLLLESQENNVHKLQYLTACKNLERKQADIELLLEATRQLDERAADMELRGLREKVATRRVVQKLIEELWRFERLENLEQSSSFFNERRIRLLQERIEELHSTLTELKTKKLRKAKSVKQTIEPTSNILDYYDKDRTSFITDLTKKLQAQLNSLERERSSGRQQHEQQEKLLRVPSIFRPYDVDCLVLFDRLGVKKYLCTTSEEEYYECFDFELFLTLQMKVITIDELDFSARSQAQKGLVASLQKTIELTHVNLLRNVSVYVYAESHVLVLRDWFRGVTLRDFISKYDGISEAMLKHIVKVVAVAMLHVRTTLGSQDIIHPNSILLDKADIKLTDYGLPHYSTAKWAELNRIYYPPEFWRSGSTDKLATWSIAITFYECYYGKVPFKYELDDLKKFEFHEDVDFPPKPALSQPAKALIKQCLSPNAHTRPQLSALLRHEYFSQK